MGKLLNERFEQLVNSDHSNLYEYNKKLFSNKEINWVEDMYTKVHASKDKKAIAELKKFDTSNISDFFDLDKTTFAKLKKFLEKWSGETAPKGLKESTSNLNESIKLRPFTKNDWYGYAGAERPAENIEPMIAEDVPVASDFSPYHEDDSEATIVVDKEGIGILASNAEYYNECGFEKAKKIASSIPLPISRKYLLSHGFTMVR